MLILIYIPSSKREGVLRYGVGAFLIREQPCKVDNINFNKHALALGPPVNSVRGLWIIISVANKDIQQAATGLASRNVPTRFVVSRKATRYYWMKFIIRDEYLQVKPSANINESTLKH